MIAEFQKSGDSQEAVKPASSLQTRAERCVVGRSEMDPIYRKVVVTRDKFMEEKGYDWLESTEPAIHDRCFLLKRRRELQSTHLLGH